MVRMIASDTIKYCKMILFISLTIWSFTCLSQDSIYMKNLNNEEVLFLPKVNQINYKLGSVSGGFQCYSHFEGKYTIDSGKFFLGFDESIYIESKHVKSINKDCLCIIFHDGEFDIPYSFYSVEMFLPQIMKEIKFETNKEGKIC